MYGSNFYVNISDEKEVLPIWRITAFTGPMLFKCKMSNALKQKQVSWLKNAHMFDILQCLLIWNISKAFEESGLVG